MLKYQMKAMGRMTKPELVLPWLQGHKQEFDDVCRKLRPVYTTLEQVIADGVDMLLFDIMDNLGCIVSETSNAKPAASEQQLRAYVRGAILKKRQIAYQDFGPSTRLALFKENIDVLVASVPRTFSDINGRQEYITQKAELVDLLASYLVELTEAAQRHVYLHKDARSGPIARIEQFQGWPEGMNPEDIGFLRTLKLSWTQKASAQPAARVLLGINNYSTQFGTQSLYILGLYKASPLAVAGNLANSLLKSRSYFAQQGSDGERKIVLLYEPEGWDRIADILHENYAIPCVFI